MADDSRHSELFFDQISEILLKLRIKTLLKFKCVCRLWFSLISSSHFQEEHYNYHSHQNPLFLTTKLENYDLISRKIELHFTISDNKEERKYSKTVPYFRRLFTPQSCRGIICLGSIHNRNLFLINPSTEELLVLPQAPRRNKCCIGLGIAPSTQEFQVVWFSKDYIGEATHCEIFTLGTNYWREVAGPPHFADMEVTPFVDGSFHLLPLLDDSHSQAGYISAFNVETEEYKEIHLPEHYNLFVAENTMEKVYLSELEGSLCLTLVFSSKLEIWLLNKSHSEEWTNKHTIKISSLAAYFSLKYMTYPMVIMKDGSIILNILGMVRAKALRYDPYKNVVTNAICVDSYTSVVTYFVEVSLP